MISLWKFEDEHLKFEGDVQTRLVAGVGNFGHALITALQTPQGEQVRLVSSVFLKFIRPVHNWGMQWWNILINKQNLPLFVYFSKKNVFVSPVAVYSVLLTLMAGADGETKTELQKTLGIEGTWKTFIESGDFLYNVLGSYKSSMTLFYNRQMVTLLSIGKVI